MSIKISQLSASTSVTGSDLIATVINNSSSLITTKATVRQVFDYITSSITDLTLNNITVLDNTILGNSSADLLLVEATSEFNSDIMGTNVLLSGDLQVSANTSLNYTTASSLYVYQDAEIIGNTALSTVTATVAQLSQLTSSAAAISELTSSNGQFEILSASNGNIVNLTGSDATFTSVTASFSGDGLNLTNIPNGALQNSTITIGSTTISLGDTSTVLQGLTEITAASAYFQGNVFINGTASIAQLNTLNEQSLVVGDKYITILSGASDHVSLDGSGILWGSGTTDLTTDELGAAAHVRYVNSYDKLRIFPGLYVSGALTASSEISGTVAHFQEVYINNISGSQAQFTSITGNLIGTLFGNADTVTNGVYTTGDQSIGGIKTFSNIVTASAGISGSFAKFISITGSFISGNVATFSQITASLSGNGSNITDVTASNITNFTNDVRSQFTPGANITIVGGVISSTGGGGPGTGSFSTAVNLITGNLTLDDTYHTIYADASAGDITVTLPLAATYNGVEFIIKKIDTSTTTVVTVSGSGGELIDGLTHIPLDYRFEGITVQNDGTSSWFVNSDVSSEVTLIAQGYINPVGSNALYILTGTAAGADDSTVQFNNSGLLSGSNQLTYNYTNGILSGTIAKFTAITASSLTNAKLNNLTTNVALLSSNTTLNSDQHVILASASLSNLFITLPSCSNSEHRQYIIKKVDSNSFKIIISGSGGELIDGIDGREINTQYETLTLVSNGISEWFIL